MLNGDGNENGKKKINRLSSNKKITLHHFFFTAAHFYLAGFSLLTASFSPFLTADIKFSCCFSNKIRLLCFLSLALALFPFSHVKCRHHENLVEKGKC